MELTKRFADFIVNKDYEDIPDKELRTAKERLLDTIGAMLAGYEGWDYTDALIQAMKNMGEGQCEIIGKAASNLWPAARAAMLNSTFAHAVELDDGHKFAGVHAGAVVIPTALTIGAKLKSTGKEVLAAIVLGYEIVYRLAVAQSPDLINRGFHPSSTCDTIGAMAVAGKLMKLNEEQMANGLGLSGLQASGLMEATVSGQQSKCIMVGNAAYKGISCAYMAKEGLEGTITVFEGSTGLFQAMSKEVNLDEICNGLGNIYLIADTYSKFYPTCRHSQPAIEAVLNLALEHNIDPLQVNNVQVGTHRVAYELTGKINAPKNAGEAKFSIPYGVALAMIEKGISVSHLKEKAYTNEMYLNLAKRVNVFIDDDINAKYPKRRGARVEIFMKDGKSYEESCYDLKGSPQNPVAYDELVGKFHIAAKGILKPDIIEEVLKRCESFENEYNIKGFLRLLSW